MSSEKAGDPSDRFRVDANAQTHFAWLRTRLAVERTMMAYLRTAVSLIGFGFTIFQFFYKLHQAPESHNIRFPEAAWYVGLALIFCGIMAALLAIFQYRWTLRYLWSGGYAAIAGMSGETRQTPLYAIAILLVMIGVFAFLAVLLRLV